jgi:mono/diheme cytochrome c family protein
MTMRRYLWCAGLLGLMGSAMGACAHGPGATPWPMVETLLQGRVDDERRPALESGREIYHGLCARCHAPVGMDRVAAEEWPDVVARMSRLSRLSPEQETDLAGYVEASIHEVQAATDMDRPGGLE